MRRTTAWKLCGLVLIALPLAAGAAEGEERPAFSDADSNGDGTITIEEATSVGVPEKEAKREDIDNDGELTKADWKFVDMEGMKTEGDGGDSGSSSGGNGNGSDESSSE
jgi:hypothetical protein